MLMLCMGISAITVTASTGDGGDGDPPQSEATQQAQTLIVNAAWLDGETIRIDVTDPQTGSRSSIAVPVSDHLRNSESVEFIIIQAVDPYGRQSGVIEIRNPFFNPNLSKSNDADNDVDNNANGANDMDVENNGEDGQDNPENETSNDDFRLLSLTPDGTGTVVDNVTDRDGGREFFTIFSEDGNEFFLIIDRHRNAENVYFLNAVTEEDLMVLARRNGRDIENNANNSVSAIPIPPQLPDNGDTGSDNESDTPEPEPAAGRPTALSRIGNNLLIFGGIVAVVGGIAYYMKVVRPRKEGFSSDYDDEPDDYGYEDDNDDDGYSHTDESELEDGDDD